MAEANPVLLVVLVLLVLLGIRSLSGVYPEFVRRILEDEDAPSQGSAAGGEPPASREP